MKHYAILLHTLTGIVVLSRTVCAQSFVVTAQSARFMDGETTVAAVPRDTEIYAIEIRGKWLQAVEPGSLKPYWISTDDVARRQRSVDTRRMVNALADQVKDIERFINADSVNLRQLATAEQCAKKLCEALGTIHPRSALAVQYAGLAAQKTRSYAQAEQYLTKALHMWQRIYGRDSAQSAEIHLDLAFLYADTGSLADAARQAKASAVINAQIYGSQHPNTIQAFIPLAMTMESISDDEAAVGYYQKVLDVYRQEYGSGDLRTLKIEGRIADVLSRQNRREKAIDTYQRILTALQNQPDVDERWIARTELQIALLKLDPTDTDAVAEFLDQASTFRRHYAADAAFAISCQERLIAELLKSGQTDKAFQIMDESLKQLRQQVRIDIWGMSAQQQTDYLSFADGSRFFQALAVAVKYRSDPQIANLSAEWLINAKGLIRETQAVQSGYRDNLSRRNLWAEQPYVGLKSVQQSLPDGAAFVDLIRYSADSDGASQTDHSAAQYAAWITSQDSGPRVIVLGNAQEIDQQIAELLTQLSTTARQIPVTGEPAAMNALRPSLTKVSRVLWQPVIEACGNHTTLLISPDQKTWLLPWTAMLNADGTFAVETHQIQFELSGRDLLRGPDAKSASNAVVFADPDYGPESDDRRQDTGQYGATFGRLPPVRPLPSSAGEAARVRPALQQLTNRDPQILLSKQADELRFKSLQSPSVVLISTHGYFLPPAALQGQKFWTDDPLLQCGLMLAGANQHTAFQNLENDGVLTGIEIARTDLSHTRLAVLSACETGIGALDATGGVVGLRRAFHLAGAQCVLSTLWSIPDRDTTYLIADFFESLSRAPDARMALQTAQQQRIRQHRKRYGDSHPFFWAAFTVSGNMQANDL